MKLRLREKKPNQNICIIMDIRGKEQEKLQQCNQKKKNKQSILLLWSQHIPQNTRKTAALASLNSYLFSSLKSTIEKLERQLVLYFEIQTASLGYQGKEEKNILRKQKSKQRNVKEKIMISSTVIYCTNMYRS